MSLEIIELWHRRARPDPHSGNFDVQFGCHLEEIVEMLNVMQFRHIGEVDLLTVSSGHELRKDAVEALTLLADQLKAGKMTATISDRREFLDSIADQVVTGIGSAHCAHMRGAEAVARVNTSNWSKFKDGQPIFNETGKIMKNPETYHEPDLSGLY